MYARVEPAYPDYSHLDELNDAELVRLAKRGTDAALEVLVRRHSEPLFRFCLHLAATREDAEDIFQETMTRVVSRVDTLQTGAKFRSWLFMIARNLAMDTYRGKKRTAPLPDEEITPLPVFTDGPEERVEIAEEQETVAQALGRLAQSHQQVLMLREVHGLSYADIAHKMDVSQSAVETLLFRARRRLREEYNKTAAPVVAVLGSMRGLMGRVAAPIAGGSPVAGKVAVTALLVGGAGIAAPQVLPVHHLSASLVPQAHQVTHTGAAHRAPVAAPRMHTAFHAMPAVLPLKFAVAPAVQSPVHLASAASKYTARPVRHVHAMRTHHVASPARPSVPEQRSLVAPTSVHVPAAVPAESPASVPAVAARPHPAHPAVSPVHAAPHANRARTSHGTAPAKQQGPHEGAPEQRGHGRDHSAMSGNERASDRPSTGQSQGNSTATRGRAGEHPGHGQPANQGAAPAAPSGRAADRTGHDRSSHQSGAPAPQHSGSGRHTHDSVPVGSDARHAAQNPPAGAAVRNDNNSAPHTASPPAISPGGNTSAGHGDHGSSDTSPTPASTTAQAAGSAAVQASAPAASAVASLNPSQSTVPGRGNEKHGRP